MNRNKERDQEVNEYYEEKKWNIKRVWEHEVKENLNIVINELSEFIDSAKDI